MVGKSIKAERIDIRQDLCFAATRLQGTSFDHASPGLQGLVVNLYRFGRVDTTPQGTLKKRDPTHNPLVVWQHTRFQPVRYQQSSSNQPAE